MLTKSGIHAIRALTILAQVPDGLYQGAAAIARATAAPANYLGKLLHTMVRAGLVESQKGLGGGFRLARPPHAISILDVVDAIDGVGRFESCIFGGTNCSDVHPCAVHHRWAAVRGDYLEMLRATRIVDLLASSEHRGVLLVPTGVLEDIQKAKEA